MAEKEICGFLDVKYCGSKSKVHKVKKRTLGPWKVWKRHWCSFQKLNSELGIKVHLDYCIGNDNNSSSNDKENFIIIPLNAVICRTQSRSKQFAFGIFPIKERKPLLYLAGNSETESQRWMANIRQLLKPRKLKIITGSYNVSMVDNSHSKASGLTEASKLLQDLVTQGRGPRHKQINRKPLSLSESDIRIVSHDEHLQNYSIANKKMELNILNERYEEISCKVLNKLTENVYQSEPYNYYHIRKFSDISLTSGIYEEISDESSKNAAATSSFYIEHFFYNHSSEEPPPLPPRQRCASESMKESRLPDVRVSGSNSLSLTSHRNSIKIEKNNLEFQRIMDESNYVPMSPRLKDITLLEMQATMQENDYVIMQ
ncbi:uncharacterized protein LOC122719462 isoform X5 [Apis laboriosa]|uniref:uncharacterized protein LOC122719462 isoform X5 n=1 Tax=Apis laboriosa TaxID=183418 RepID=UPI001CC67A64|nr:uncharacterized protein LOC122719462 isoform X5 [Apis laboriosa]